MGSEDQKSAESTLLLIVALLLAGCDHTGPFPPQQPANAPPRGGGNPVLVTYNLGTDLRPAWLPDGSGFFYTQERMDRADQDRCLVRMNEDGGSVLEAICDRSASTDDSIATFEWAAVSSDERLAYLRAGTPVSPPTLAPRTLELRLGTRTEPAGAAVRAFPYTASSGQMHQSFSFLQWIDASHLVYLAENVSYPAPCPGCAPDTVRTGLEIVTIEVGTGAMEILPGTAGATGVALSGSDTVYYTLDTSSTIWRRVRSTGGVSGAHTFPEVVMEVSAGGGRLAVVTGFGALWYVDPWGTVLQLEAPTPTFFRRPALSPNGRRLIVEGYTTSTAADLWLFQLR